MVQRPLHHALNTKPATSCLSRERPTTTRHIMAAFEITRRSISLGEKEIIIEHGKLALQASGAVTVQ